MNQVIAIIPARAESEKVPDKHINLLNGKPLIAWTIEAAIESSVFDEVVVNTDCPEIATIARKHGAKVPFIRPPYLSEDDTPTSDVLRHTLEWYKAKQVSFSEVMMLHPTSPLREKKAITEAWDLYLQSQAESLVSVCELEHPIQWTYRLTEDLGLTALFQDHSKRRQEYEKNYRLNGAIYITKTEPIFAGKELFPAATSIAYVMSKYQSIDIDEKEDFLCAEFLMKKNSNQVK
jgi:CMP-N-acetylneuraminic acid synthetase